MTDNETERLRQRVAERDATIARLREALYVAAKWIGEDVDDLAVVNAALTDAALSRVHKPTEACVDTCDNPYVCADEYNAALAEQPASTPDPRDATIARLRGLLIQWTELYDASKRTSEIPLKGIELDTYAALAEQPSTPEAEMRGAAELCCRCRGCNGKSIGCPNCATSATEAAKGET